LQTESTTTKPQSPVAGTSTDETTVRQQPRHANDRPALPRRRPQEHLARQLQGEVAAGGNGQLFEPDLDLAAQHAQNTLSAFQRGTERGRTNGDKPQP
jgi:hypothetical protein